MSEQQEQLKRSSSDQLTGVQHPVSEEESQRRSYNVDNVEAIPPHIFNYINHLYQKKQHDSHTNSLPNLNPKVSIFMVEKSKLAIKTLKDEEDAKKKQQNDLSKQADRYLKKVFRMSMLNISTQQLEEERQLVQRQNYLTEKKAREDEQLEREIEQARQLERDRAYRESLPFFTREDDESQSQLYKTNTNSQYISTSIQEVVQGSECDDSDDSDYNTDRIIKSVQEASSSIVDQLYQLKSAMKDQNQSMNFIDRQQAHKMQSQHKLQMLKYETQNQNQSSFTPKLKKNQKMINSYHSRQFNSANNGHQKKITQKQNHTQTASYINEFQSKQKIQKAVYKQKIQEQFWDSSKRKVTTEQSDNQATQNVQDQLIQTDWSESQHSHKSNRQEQEQDLYVPIQDRVPYILESRQNKIEIQLEQRKFNEESYYQTLTFTPELGDSQLISMSKDRAQEFSSSQLGWQKKLDQRALRQKINDTEISEEFTHQPQITPKSRKLAVRNMDQSFNERQLEASLKAEMKLQLLRQYQYPHHPNPTKRLINLVQEMDLMDDNQIQKQSL